MNKQADADAECHDEHERMRVALTKIAEAAWDHHDGSQLRLWRIAVKGLGYQVPVKKLVKFHRSRA